MKKEGKIVVNKNGPYTILDLPLSEGIIKTDNKGYPLSIKKIKDYQVDSEYHLCRCGHSSNKPFCDGSHIKIKFRGTETAEKENFEELKDIIEGPNFII